MAEQTVMTVTTQVLEARRVSTPNGPMVKVKLSHDNREYFLNKGVAEPEILSWIVAEVKHKEGGRGTFRDILSWKLTDAPQVSSGSTAGTHHTNHDQTQRMISMSAAQARAVEFHAGALAGIPIGDPDAIMAALTVVRLTAVTFYRDALAAGEGTLDDIELPLPQPAKPAARPNTPPAAPAAPARPLNQVPAGKPDWTGFYTKVDSLGIPRAEITNLLGSSPAIWVERGRTLDQALHALEEVSHRGRDINDILKEF